MAEPASSAEQNNQRNNHVMLVGGGTAGHVIPALPVIQSLQQAGHRITFVGTTSGLEERLVAGSGVSFKTIAAGKLRRYWSWQNFTDVGRILLGVLQSMVLLLKDRPGVVFSKGGFVSFPLAFAAWLLRIPVVAHESDYSPGLANRLLLPFARVLCTSFAQTHVKPRSGLTVIHTGTPVRHELLQGDAARGRQTLQVPQEQPLLVVTGGSLGADTLNGVVATAAPALTEHFAVFHVCGAGKMSQVQCEGYQQAEYVSDGWGDILAAADVVVSRAGANALFELLALRKVCLLVPLSARASRGDQLENADFAQSAGFAEVVFEEELDAAGLVETVLALYQKRSQVQENLLNFSLPDATSAIVREIHRFL